MNRVMSVCIFLIANFFLNSSNQVQESGHSFIGKSFENKDTILHIENKHASLDSVSIEYFNGFDPVTYDFKYSNGVIKVSSRHSSLHKTIVKEITVNKFTNYIDTFFIAKTQPIQLSKVKRSPVATDYGRFKIKGYKDRNELINNTIKIGEESYDIIFNPKFIEFIEFLDELAKGK